MAMRSQVEIAIVGAGIVGLAAALRLAAEGRDVVVVDPNEPGAGASFGNAGTLAPYACVPVGNPDVLRSLPSLLLRSDSPFAMRWAALPQLAPWLARFVRQSFPARARANAVALCGLLKDALPAWRELAAAADASALLREGGCLYAFRKAGDSDAGSWAAAMRAELGVRFERLTTAQVAALEPNLPAMAGGGVLFPEAVRIIDPAALTTALAVALEGARGAITRAAVERIDIRSDGLIWLDGPGFSMEARKVVIATGAWSKPLAAQAGDRIPLETERGYHVEFAAATPRLGRPVCPIDLGFYLTPMEGRLRAAGTVEMGGLAAPASARRLAFIESKAREIFPDLGPPISKWLGFRPSLPDSLPVIGRSRRSASVIYAFGHGHLGMTLAAITARHVVRLVSGGGNDSDLAPFAATRFTAFP